MNFITPLTRSTLITCAFLMATAPGNAAGFLFDLAYDSIFGTNESIFSPICKFLDTYEDQPEDADVVAFKLRVNDLGEYNPRPSDGPMNMDALIKILNNGYVLTKIKIFGADIQNYDINSLAWAIRDNCTVTSLSLAHQTRANIGTLIMALRNNSTITSLHLSNNDMRNDDGYTIEYLLRGGRTALTDLALVNNKLGDAGAVVIAESLMGQRKITSLCFEENELEEKGRNAMAALALNNGTITRLLVNNTDLVTNGAERKTLLYKACNRLQSFIPAGIIETPKATPSRDKESIKTKETDLKNSESLELALEHDLASALILYGAFGNEEQSIEQAIEALNVPTYTQDE
ncbi:MAG: hypothetical protein NTX76_00840 [Alphaproteobacteria bacterium]|nr:hypothetical protein [Alphaproteobacteria bacterium]